MNNPIDNRSTAPLDRSKVRRCLITFIDSLFFFDGCGQVSVRARVAPGEFVDAVHRQRCRENNPKSTKLPGSFRSCGSW